MADVAVIAFLKHYPLSSITDIFQDGLLSSFPLISIEDGLLSSSPLISIWDGLLSSSPLISIGDGLLSSSPLISIGDGLLSRTPLINIEDVNIHYCSSGVEFLPQGGGDDGRFQINTDYLVEEEPVYVY